MTTQPPPSQPSAEQPSLRSRVARNWPPLLMALVFLVFVGAMIDMGWNDHQAEARCHRLGGQTYDSGSHCTVGGHTVSTR